MAATHFLFFVVSSPLNIAVMHAAPGLDGEILNKIERMRRIWIPLKLKGEGNVSPERKLLNISSLSSLDKYSSINKQRQTKTNK